MSEAAGADEAMRGLLLDLAKTLVDQPEAVSVDIREVEASTSLSLTVAPSDVGKIIGKQGRTARSLRSIVLAAGKKLQKRYTIDIEEYNGNK